MVIVQIAHGLITELSNVDDHLVEEILVLRKILQQLVFGYPREVLAFSNMVLRCANHL